MLPLSYLANYIHHWFTGLQCCLLQHTLGMAIYRCHIDISIFLNIQRDTIFYFTYRYTFDISYFIPFHLLLSHLMSLDQKWKMHIFLSCRIFSMSAGNKFTIIRYMGNSALYEKLKISEISMWYRYIDIDVKKISIWYRYWYLQISPSLNKTIRKFGIQ